jgi:hypothetical protein
MAKKTVPSSPLKAKLSELETVIEKGVSQVGYALSEIRDAELYKLDHATFNDYVTSRWGFSVRRAQQLIQAAKVTTRLIEDGAKKLPNTKQAVELSKVPAEEQSEVWEEVATTNAKPTAKKIKATVEQKQAPKPARHDADQPEHFLDEDGNDVPQHLYPVWRDIPAFYTIADQVRSCGIPEIAEQLRLLGEVHDSPIVLDAAAELVGLHSQAVTLVLGCKPAIVTASGWLTKGEVAF